MIVLGKLYLCELKTCNTYMAFFLVICIFQFRRTASANNEYIIQFMAYTRLSVSNFLYLNTLVDPKLNCSATLPAALQTLHEMFF